jgi:hypothetical protein
MLRSHAVATAFATVLVLGLAPQARAQPQDQAQEPPKDQRVEPGKEQGLGLTGPEVPQALKDAQSNPYQLPPRLDCSTLSQHIAELDRVLGPDVDTPQMKTEKNKTEDLMAGVRAVLPYGGVARMLTGAGKKEQALVNAALASWERRGYLKGLAHSRGCSVGGVAVPTAAVVKATPPATTPTATTPTTTKKKKKKASS